MLYCFDSVHLLVFLLEQIPKSCVYSVGFYTYQRIQIVLSLTLCYHSQIYKLFLKLRVSRLRYVYGFPETPHIERIVISHAVVKHSHVLVVLSHLREYHCLLSSAERFHKRAPRCNESGLRYFLVRYFFQFSCFVVHFVIRFSSSYGNVLEISRVRHIFVLLFQIKRDVQSLFLMYSYNLKSKFL